MSNKKEKQIEVEITENMTQVFNDIKDYLCIRLAYDALTMKLEQAKKIADHRPNKDVRINFVLESPSIKVDDQSTGLFKFIIKEFHIETRGSYNMSDNSWVAEISYRYTHHNGGNNGHVLNFRLKGNFFRGDHEMIETE